MSYSEDKGEIVLRMSRDDYDRILAALGMMAAALLARGHELRETLEFHNRLNQGNPNYTPYKIQPLAQMSKR